MENDSQHTGHVSYSYISMKANRAKVYIFLYIILIGALNM